MHLGRGALDYRESRGTVQLARRLANGQSTAPGTGPTLLQQAFRGVLIFFSLLLLWGTRAESAEGQGTAADTVGGDSLAVARDSVRVDSIRQERSDPALVWKTWKDISQAIALRPLDGPDDILEKAEIIEDRIDDLREEEEKLKASSKEWEERRQSLELQLEVLDDLAEVQRGGDLQLQQRMHSLRGDMGKAGRRIRVLTEALEDLDEELDHMTGLVVEYGEKSADLRRREEERR